MHSRVVTRCCPRVDALFARYAYADLVAARRPCLVRRRARGEAAQFDRVYEQYRLAPEVTRRRMYYETMEAVLAKTDKTIVEPPGVTPYLPLNQNRGARPPAAAVVEPAPGGSAQPQGAGR